jgi:uncharacterized protein
MLERREGAAMTVTATPAHVGSADASVERRRHPWLEAAGSASGLCAAVLASADGSPWWRAVRFVVIVSATAAVVVALRPPRRRRRGVIAVAAGVPLVAIAIGFAPHWVSGDVGLVPVASAVLTVAAVAFTVMGVRAATSDAGRWRCAVTGFGVLVAVVVTTFVVGPAVAATNPTHADLGATPDRVGLPYVDVVRRTEDGVDIAGWYVESSNGAAVVLLHGAGSTRSDVLEHAVALSAAGFGVLMIDARGHGASGGRAMNFGWDGDADIAAATAYLATRPDVDRGRIGLVGLSMGGEQALGASGTDDLVRAVVAEGATARCAADEAWLSDRYGVRGWITEQLEVAQDWATAALTDADVPTSMHDAVDASGETHFLLIAAEHEPDEIEAAAYIASAAPDRVTTWTVPGAHHTGGLEIAPAEWTAHVTAFLDEHLEA